MSQFFEFFLINFAGKCLFYEDFIENSSIDKFNNDNNEIARLKNIVGISIALKAFSCRMSPTPRASFKSFTTGKYKLSFYESASGLKFILISAVDDIDYTSKLQTIYSDIYMEYVNRNPLYEKDNVIEFQIFRDKIKEYLSKLLVEENSS